MLSRWLNLLRDRYTQILLWAYSKQKTGFTWREFTSKFASDPVDELWLRRVFLTENGNDRRFVEEFRYDETENAHYYSLNEKGINAALAARESERISFLNILAIGLSTLGVIASTASLWIAISSLEATKRSLELATPPVLEIENGRSGENLALRVSNRSLSNLENITLQMEVMVFPRKIDGDFLICDFTTLISERIPMIPAGETFSKSFNFSGLYALILKVQKEAYGGVPINGVVRIKILFERALDHQSFIQGKNFLMFDENQWLELPGAMSLAVFTDSYSDGTLGADQLSARLNESLLNFEAGIVSKERIRKCPAHDVINDVYTKGVPGV